MVGGTFCDLERASDCVNCSVLLTELQFDGITNKADVLTESQFTVRYQWVMINTENHNYNNI